MAHEELPGDVSRFIISFIDSVEQLNVLLLLLKDPGRDWTSSEISAEMRSTEGSIARRLQDLYSRGVLRASESSTTHRFLVEENLKSSISQLESAYRERPLRIIELIYSQPPMALRAFANAFNFRKEEK